MGKKAILLLTVFLSACAFSQNTFTNPLKASGPDPWAIYKDGWYYYMNTSITNAGENELRLWRTKKHGRDRRSGEQVHF